MSPTRRVVLHAGLAWGLGSAVRTARACEFFSTHLRITHPWTRASKVGATEAAICMKFDEVARTDRLIGVESPVCGGAEMGGVAGRRALDLLIPRDRETVLTEAGVHVRLVELKFPLEIGRSYPLRLIFENAGGVNAGFEVDYAAAG